MVKIRKLTLLISMIFVLLVASSASAIQSFEAWKADCTHNNTILEIDKVDFDDDNLKPGDDIKVEIKVQNNDDDYEINDVDLEVYFIPDLEDDDGDDIEDDDSFDINDDDDETLEFEWTPTQDFDDGDDYTFMVRAKSNDFEGNSSWVLCAWEDGESVSFEKEKYKLEFYKATISPSVLQCSRNLNVRVGLKNIGEKDIDDGTITVSIPDLGLERVVEFENVDSNVDDEDNTVEKSIAFQLEEDPPAGIYPVNINVEYRDGRETEFETLDLEVKDCVRETDTADEKENTKQEEDSANTIVVQEPTTPVVTPPTVVEPTTQPTTTEPEEKSFFGSGWFIGLIIFVDLLIIVVGIVLVVSLTKKK